MEGADKGTLDQLRDEDRHALLHLVRRLRGEGERDHFEFPRVRIAQQTSDATGEDAGLSGARPRQHQRGTVTPIDGGALDLREIGQLCVKCFGHDDAFHSLTRFTNGAGIAAASAGSAATRCASFVI